MISRSQEQAASSSSPRKKTKSLALVAVLVAAVAAGSFLPEEQKQVLHSRGRFHFLGHLAVFFFVGYLGARAVESRRGRLLVLCAAICLGVAIEFGEHIVFHGLLERKDILVDALGAIAGTLLASITASRD